MPPDIRPEKPSDARAIEQVIIDAFRNAPHSDRTEQFIVRELRRANALTLSLVAEACGQIVGHVAVSPVQISDGSRQWFGLGPIAVAPPQQGNGIGSRLMRAALEKLQALGAHGCVLLGDPGYYCRFGFRPVAGLELPGLPAAYFLALSFGPAVAQGQVTYHPAFGARQ